MSLKLDPQLGQRYTEPVTRLSSATRLLWKIFILCFDFISLFRVKPTVYYGKKCNTSTGLTTFSDPHWALLLVFLAAAILV